MQQELKVKIHLESSWLGQEGISLKGQWARGEEGFLLTWWQPPMTEEEEGAHYALTYEYEAKILSIHRQGEYAMKLSFSSDEPSFGRIDTPHGQLEMEFVVEKFQVLSDWLGTAWPESALYLRYSLQGNGGDESVSYFRLFLKPED